jgi:hypothetical protein
MYPPPISCSRENVLCKQPDLSLTKTKLDTCAGFFVKKPILPRLGFCRLRMRHKNKTRITIRRNPPTPAITAIISSLLKVLLDLSSLTGGFHGKTIEIKTLSRTNLFLSIHCCKLLPCTVLHFYRSRMDTLRYPE